MAKSEKRLVHDRTKRFMAAGWAAVVPVEAIRALQEFQFLNENEIYLRFDPQKIQFRMPERLLVSYDREAELVTASWGMYDWDVGSPAHINLNIKCMMLS